MSEWHWPTLSIDTMPPGMSLPYRPAKMEDAAFVDDEVATRPLRYRLEADDWGWRGPEGSPAVPGESRFSFLLRLGFHDHNPFHRKIFEAMKMEVLSACQPLLEADVEITLTTVSHLESSIFDHASPLTRTIYELASPFQDNWIIRWMMWHVIEAASESRLSPPAAKPSYRRDISLTAPSPLGRSDSVIASTPPSKPSPPRPIAKPNKVRKIQQSSRKMARKERVPHLVEGALASSVAFTAFPLAPPVNPTPRSTYWDPIRSP